MGKNKETVEIADAETGEVVRLSTTALVAGVRDYLLSKRRLQIQATEWAKLSENDQKDEVAAVTNTAIDLVEAVVDAVAAAGRSVIHAKLDSFKIKDGVVTITAKGTADDGALLDLNHVGQKNLKIFVADAQQHDQDRPQVPIARDQEDLPLDGVEEKTPAADTMSDEDIEDTAQQMDDADDLQDQVDDQDEPALGPEPEDDPEPNATSNVPPLALGQQAALQGAGPDENPFDGGSKDHGEWARGYHAALDEIESIKADGRKAEGAGKDRDGGKWKEGTDAYNIWMQGYDEARAERQDKVEDTEIADEAPEPDATDTISGAESDSYGEGRSAAM